MIFIYYIFTNKTCFADVKLSVNNKFPNHRIDALHLSVYEPKYKN